MADLSLSARVIFEDASTLELDVPGVYRVVSFSGRGARSWRRQVATSPDIRGRALVRATMDTVIRTLVVRVYGTDVETLDTNVETLFDAFSQPSYRLDVVIGGEHQRYQCEPADGGPVADTLDKYELMAAPMRQTYGFQIPGDPVSLDGAL